MDILFDISILILILFNILLALYIIFLTTKLSRESDFLISAFLFGLIFFAHLNQFFDAGLQIFFFLEIAVVLGGALMGGVFALLLPNIISGFTFGVLFSEYILMLRGDPISYGSVDMVVYAISVVIGILAATNSEKLLNGLKVSFGASLFIVLAINDCMQLFGFTHSLWTDLSNSLLLEDPNNNNNNNDNISTSTNQEHVIYFVVWTLFSIAIFYGKGYYSYATNICKFSGYYYSQLPTQGEENKQTYSVTQRTFSYPDALVINYFDPDVLPSLVRSYADDIFALIQSISAIIGFQIDNSRNQAEHLLMLLSNECKRGEIDQFLPPTRLHDKLFSNYIKWCNSLNIDPIFTPISDDKPYAAKIQDMCVFLLIWGECANIKHMPECLCFLYHKTMQHFLSETERANSSRHYPGHFLDTVIAPIYDVISNSMRVNGDHASRKTYDDFNEFFWSKSCLQYSHYHPLNNIDSFSIDNQTTIAEALQESTKTYIEKRSWLHPLLSFHRIFEWHVITFTLLATLAFRNSLIWKTSYTLFIGSFIFWEINFLSLIWICLEIWTLFPTSSLTGPVIYGYILRLLATYVILLYQSIYYYWASRTDTPPEDSVRALGDSNFWWWQYIWISLFALTLYFIETIFCWTPKVYSFIMTSKNSLIQILLNILYPFSELYVGKEIHTTQTETFTYIFFWLTLISFKLWFGYYYIIFPIAIPSIELFDDYMNFPEVTFFKTSILMTIWWFPHFMVYLIDMSIWFSVWCAIIGGFQALYDRQGSIRNYRDVRAYFMQLPKAFHGKFLPSDDNTSLYTRTVSRLSTIALPSKTGYQSENNYQQDQENYKEKQLQHQIPTVYANRVKSTNELDNYCYSINDEEELKSVEVSHDINNNQSHMEEFLDIRSQKWVNFSRIWNEIILKLRDGDLLSNTERDILLFTNFNWLSKPTYLPLYQTAGRIEAAIYNYKNAAISYHDKDSDPAKKILIAQEFKKSLDMSSIEAISELWELGAYVIIGLMGKVHSEDLKLVFQLLQTWAISDTIYNHFSLNNLSTIIDNISSIIGSLRNCLKQRSKNPIVSKESISQYQQRQANLKHKEKSISSGGLKKSISTGFLNAITSNSSNIVTESHDISINKNKNNTITNSSSLNENDKIVSSRKSDLPKHTELLPFRATNGISDRVRDKIRDDIRAILNILKDSLRKGGSGSDTTIIPAAQSLLDRITFILSLENGFLWDDIYASSRIDELAQDPRISPMLNKMNGLIKLRQTEIEPASPEAKRRLHFFVSSLFMTMPSAPSMIDSKDYTCMTPFYTEDVLLTKNDLESKNSDGVSTLLYLQTLYKKDWHNFLERFNINDDQLIWSSQYIQETRIWASMRAQTLFRTVEGMMFTESSIRLLSEIEGLSQKTIDVLTKLKFSYVIAAQAYASMKKSGDHKADDIDFLLSRHPNLRVAYIDSIRPPKNQPISYYSILIKYDTDDNNDNNSNNNNNEKQSQNKIKEVYRIQLPGSPLLGEGKPENQNHALIFSRGRYLQAIDMNQAGYFEEALKMRNLLQEFDHTGCKILGFREHIFTGSVSSVANYMALQELSFVTLGQRVLTKPLKIRQHYGHPDMFDKLFIMTEGGMSKASRGINLSEDVFAGFNATIRGHKIEFKEYAHVGKGRDVGLQQTYKFEAKLSQGNAEQSISRDMNRLCTRLDFFRLMSFYYGGIGHYMSNTLVMFTLVLVVYTMSATALFHEEGINGRSIKPEGVLQIMLAGMGILQTLPLCATLIVEKGFFKMIIEITTMILSGGPLYFIFHIQTKSFYFQQTLLAGGAKYRATGRGFVTRHSSFDENFRFFASSHLYLGFEIMITLIIYGIFTNSKQYFGLTWSLWLVVISFLLGPFWFNPLSFEISKVSEDYDSWMRWMNEIGGVSEQSWSVWWKEEIGFIRDLSLSWKFLLVLTKCLMWGTIGVGLLGKRFFHSHHEQIRLLKLILVVLLFLLFRNLLKRFRDNLSYALRRITAYTFGTLFILSLGYLFIHHPQLLRYSVSLYYIISSINYILLICNFTDISQIFCKYHDYFIGHFIFSIIFLMAMFCIGILQTWLLYHNALSAGVVMEDILKYARKTKERADNPNEITLDELKSLLAQHERKIQQLSNSANNDTNKSNELTSLLSTTDGNNSNNNINLSGSNGSVGGSNKTGELHPLTITNESSTSNGNRRNNYGTTGLTNDMNIDQNNQRSNTIVSPRGILTPLPSGTSSQTPRVHDSVVDPNFIFSQPEKLPPRT